MSDRPLHEVVKDHMVTTVGGWTAYGPVITDELAAVLKVADALRLWSDRGYECDAYDDAVADLRRALEGR